MFLSIRELELGKIRFNEVFPPESIEFFDKKLWQASPAEIVGIAELHEATAEITVRGHLKVSMEAECDRCLETASFPIDTDFELFYMPASSLEAAEASIDESELEMGFYEGSGLELAGVVSEQILLSLPMQRICRADCRGLCPLCGQNRNATTCGCQPQPIDNRWNALRDIANTHRH
jgi:uncharacterized protein